MKLSQVCLFIALLFSCKKEEIVSVLPSVETNNPSGITVKSAILSGTLTVKGSDPITDRGFIWSKSSGVSETNGTAISLGQTNDIGPFESTLDGLGRGKKYYYVAYIKTSKKSFLGKEIEFTAGAHTITSVSPVATTAGSNVTIFGTDFVSDPSRISVTIGSFNAPITTATETQIE